MSTDYSSIILFLYLYTPANVASALCFLQNNTWSGVSPASTGVRISNFWNVATGTGQDGNWVSLKKNIFAPNGFKINVLNTDSVNSHALSVAYAYRKIF
jgi:hypothetical protein